ncbi:MAG: TlpA family protein disulfide reductase [Mangrovimonas sp.]|nr:TlpA family protein disulfide reductase [Mangrovimonas sp.]
MKKLLIIALGLSILACKEEAPKDYVELTGKITNKYGDSIFIQNRGTGYFKSIPLKEDGSFNDTLKVEPGVYTFFDGNETTNLYLKNGYDINMSLDTKMFDETVKYSGTGSEQSNFLAEKSLLEEKMLDEDKLGALESLEALDKELETIKGELNKFYNANPDIDSTLVASANKNLDPILKFYRGYFADAINLKIELPKGAESPTFENYENYAGGTTSLSDLKGSYVYIDVWATWCGPCKAEIPSLKEVEAKYHDRNIKFVSISVDNGRGYRADTPENAKAASKEGWKNMVAEKELGGIQLFADNDWQSEFMLNYKVNSIPRFILIDPEGKIVSPDAPRPSKEELIKLFESLNI